MVGHEMAHILNGDMVTLYIVDPATGNTTTIQVPVGTLKPGGG